jgi:hypothetical protein
MTRVNRPDTLFTQLREIERRLRLLEGRRAALALTSVGAQPFPVPFTPARPADWPGTDSPEWTDLLRVRAGAGNFQVIVDIVADEGTTGQARVLVEGTPAGAGLATGEARHTVEVTVGSETGEIVVQARQTGGAGTVRAAALLAMP